MTETIQIAGRAIGRGHPTYIIAEIGINHDGSEDIARAMITAAAESGADAAKLQTVDVSESYLPGTPSHVEFSSRVLPVGALGRLSARARDLGIHLFTTAADLPSLAAAAAADLPAYKVSSGLLTHVPLLRSIARLGKPMLLSTGLATLEEAERAVAIASDAGANEIAVFQGTSIYPAPADTLNLAAMETMRARFGRPIGYSDHYDGDLAAIAAVAMGAAMIEKHFTFDRARLGADHRLSLDPLGFARMVRAIREVEAMRGDGVKVPTATERDTKGKIRRVLVARHDLMRGHTLRESDLRFMRVPSASASIAVERWDEVDGRALLADVPAGMVLPPDAVGLTP
jgi:N,N'-diacetyllegionaminate synthase